MTIHPRKYYHMLPCAKPSSESEASMYSVIGTWSAGAPFTNLYWITL